MDRSQQFIAIYIQNEKENYIYSARQALQDGGCEGWSFLILKMNQTWINEILKSTPPYLKASIAS